MTLNTTVLTEAIAIAAIRDFFREKPFVFFGTGMSCSVDIRFGMDSLRDALIDAMRAESLSTEQSRQWKQVADSLKTGADLESALDSVSDVDLLHKIVIITGNFVSAIDHEYAVKIAEGSVHWSASRFIKRLVDRLPEGDRILHVLTPNYDMLFEYACDAVGIPYVAVQTLLDTFNRKKFAPCPAPQDYTAFGAQASIA